MTSTPEPTGKEQRLLRHARREGLVALAVWAVALGWTTGYCYVAGYDRGGNPPPLLLGMPAWVFWGVVLPWGLSLVFSVWFCFFYMADDDLGQDREEEPRHG